MTIWTMLVLGIATLVSAYSIFIGNAWALPMELSFGIGTVVAMIEGVIEEGTIFDTS